MDWGASRTMLAPKYPFPFPPQADDKQGPKPSKSSRPATTDPTSAKASVSALIHDDEDKAASLKCLEARAATTAMAIMVKNNSRHSAVLTEALMMLYAEAIQQELFMLQLDFKFPAGLTEKILAAILCCRQEVISLICSPFVQLVYEEYKKLDTLRTEDLDDLTQLDLKTKGQ